MDTHFLLWPLVLFENSFRFPQAVLVLWVSGPLHTCPSVSTVQLDPANSSSFCTETKWLLSWRTANSFILFGANSMAIPQSRGAWTPSILTASSSVGSGCEFGKDICDKLTTSFTMVIVHFSFSTLISTLVSSSYLFYAYIHNFSRCFDLLLITTRKMKMSFAVRHTDTRYKREFSRIATALFYWLLVMLPLNAAPATGWRTNKIKIMVLTSALNH